MCDEKYMEEKKVEYLDDLLDESYLVQYFES